MALGVVVMLVVSGPAFANAAPQSLAGVLGSSAQVAPGGATPSELEEESSGDWAGSVERDGFVSQIEERDASAMSSPGRSEPDVVVDELATGEPAVIPEEDRDAVLGSDWDSADDVAWVVSGDGDGLHVLTARAASGYEWRRIATLTMRGFDTDRWVGNACLTSDETTLAVVYAPRGFTNDQSLFNHGAFAALVDIESGETRQLGAGYTLAYFNPGCGVGSEVAFTQLDETRTRIVTVDVHAADARSAVELDSQVTSAVPTESGLVAAAAGWVVEIDGDGVMAGLAPATGTPYDLAVTAAGDVAYLAHDGENATAYLASVGAESEPIPFATGELHELGVARTGGDLIHLMGSGEVLVGDVPDSVRIHEGTNVTSEVSTGGVLAVDPPFRGEDHAPDFDTVVPPADSVFVGAKGLISGTEIEFRVHDHPGEGVSSEAFTEHDESRESAGASPVGLIVTQNSSSPVSMGSPCAVPRNDPAIQAFQPNLAEVEWAVNQAVRGNLPSQMTFGRPALMGASTITGNHVPPQIMLGILAQESNFWQASRYTVPGVTGNPLMGDYFGIRSAGADEPWWTIDYGAADCGYGIAQVTTGMQSGEMPYSQQLMIATDYQANISRGLQILIEKWNETRAAGLVINNGHPKHLENWFYALWAYNTGFYPQAVNAQPWGVGWLNNPINPIYPPHRSSFLDGSPSDAANPQRWPYPEKVLGFAAHSAYFLNSVSQGELGDTFHYATAFVPAWWTSADNENGERFRRTVKPPIDLFCDESNNCDPNVSIPIPSQGYSASCYNRSYPGCPFDLRCWYNQPATWKSDCASACGYESMEYGLNEPKPASSNSYPPNCSRQGLPAGALVVDDVPPGTPPTMRADGHDRELPVRLRARPEG